MLIIIIMWLFLYVSILIIIWLLFLYWLSSLSVLWPSVVVGVLCSWTTHQFPPNIWKKARLASRPDKTDPTPNKTTTDVLQLEISLWSPTRGRWFNRGGWGGATSLAVDFSLVNLSAQQLLWDPLYPTVLDICWPFKRVHSPRSRVFFLIRTRKKPGWGTGLNNDDTTMWQFVLSYTVPAALNKTKWPSIYRSI